MSAGDLSDFVRRALAAGQDRAAIAAALSDAGWSGREVEAALQGWHDVAGMPPVPRARPYVSAREALLHALLLVALGMVCWHTSSLGFAVIDSTVPDPVGQAAYASMRFSIAALVVFLPVFLLLDRRLARRITQGDERLRSRARRGFASLTVMVAALVLLGDLAASVFALLSGDMTLRFLAKAVLVAVTGLLVLVYYKADLDG